MKIMNIHYIILFQDHLFFIKDLIEDKVITAFELNKSIKEIEDLFYYGESNEDESVHTALKAISDRYPEMFSEVTEKEMKKYRYVRELVILYSNSLIDHSLAKQFLEKVKRFLETDCSFTISIELPENKYRFLENKITNPFICQTKKENEQVELLIIDQELYSAEYHDKRAKTILFLNILSDNLKIGPIIDVEKIEVTFDDKKEVSSSLTVNESDVLQYFLNRILDSHIFELNHCVSPLPFYPSRSQLSLNRRTLEMEAMGIMTKPRYLSGE